MLNSFFGKDSLCKKIPTLLSLEKPLIIFDLETTGLTISGDKIVELAYIKIYSNGAVKRNDILLNPEMPIDREATAVHGITNDMVKDKPVFRDKAQEIWDVFYDCYYSGFNIANFDVPVLRREFVRVGMDFEYTKEQIIDCKEIFYHMVPRTLSSTYEYYCRKEFNQEHSAVTDTEAAAEILCRQLEKYSEIRNWDFLRKLQNAEIGDDSERGAREFYWRDGEAHFSFSKHIGKPVSQVADEDPDFLRWMLKANFLPEVKELIKLALDNKHTKEKNKD